MKVIVINKKRLGVSLIILGLMFLMVFFELNIQKSLRLTALIQNNQGSLKSYAAMKGALSFKLPEDWTLREKTKWGEEILYRGDFTSKDSVISGSLEVIANRSNLSDYITRTRQVLKENNELLNYKTTNIKLNERNGCRVSYTFHNASGLSYIAEEYLIEAGPQILRVSFHVREDNYRESLEAIYNIVWESCTFN